MLRVWSVGTCLVIQHLCSDQNIDRSDAHTHNTPQRHSNAHKLIHLCCLHYKVVMTDALRKERLECVLSSGFV